MTIIAVAFVIAVAGLYIYVQHCKAFDEVKGYNGSTLIIGDVPDYKGEDDYVPPLVSPFIAQPVPQPVTELRKPNGQFAKGNKPVGVVHGAGGRFVSAKAA